MVKYQYLSKLTVVHSYNAMLSAMERNKLMIHARKCMNLKCIMLNERSQIEKTHAWYLCGSLETAKLHIEEID